RRRQRRPPLCRCHPRGAAEERRPVVLRRILRHLAPPGVMPMALLGEFSVEATRPSTAELAKLAGILAPGTPVYLSRVPAETSAEQAAAAARVRRAGFEPVPHVAARALASHDELAEFLARIRGEADIRQLL